MENNNLPKNYFSVSNKKLIIMSIITLNMYMFYYFYKNWQYIKTVQNNKISAILQTILYPFFLHSFLFEYVVPQAEKNQINCKLNINVRAWIYIILFFTNPYIPFNLIPFMKIHTLINKINKKENPKVDPNDSFSKANIYGICAFGLVVLFIIAVLVLS